MRVPGADRAFVPLEKVKDYLLSEQHPVGRYKAPFFRSLGFRRDEPEPLTTALLAVLDNAAESQETTPYGTKYVVSGRLQGPGSSYADVRTVWIVRTGSDYPRLVTAYPR